MNFNRENRLHILHIHFQGISEHGFNMLAILILAQAQVDWYSTVIHIVMNILFYTQNTIYLCNCFLRQWESSAYLVVHVETFEQNMS